MKKYRPFSRKYYSEDVIKLFAKYIINKSSYIGSSIHDIIEGRKHENDAWKYGGYGSMKFENDEFEFQICVHRKSRREKSLDNLDS